MRHANSISLLTYWNTRRGNRPCPARSDIEPSEIARLLPHVFIAELGPEGSARFRLAGTALCSLAGAELKSTSVAELWHEEGRDHIETLLHSTVRKSPMILEVQGVSRTGRLLDGEILLLPLTGPEGACDRILGMVSVFDAPYWIGADPLRGFATTGTRIVVPDSESALQGDGARQFRSPRFGASAETRNAAMHFGRRRSDHLTLIEGGRKD